MSTKTKQSPKVVPLNDKEKRVLKVLGIQEVSKSELSQSVKGRSSEDLFKETDELIFQARKRRLPRLHECARLAQGIKDKEPEDHVVERLAGQIILTAQMMPLTISDEDLAQKIHSLDHHDDLLSQLEERLKQVSEFREKAGKELKTAASFASQARALITVDDRPHVKLLADEVIKKGDEAAAVLKEGKVQAMEKAVKTIPDLKSDVEKLRAATDSGLTVRKALGNVERGLQTFLKDLPFAAETKGYKAALKKQETATQLYETGGSIATDEQAIAALKDWEKDLKNGGEDKTISKTKEAKTKANQARTKAVQDLMKLMALPGADTDPFITDFLQDARDLLDRARDALDKGKTPEEFELVLQQIRSFDGLAEKVREASQEAEEKRKADLSAMPNYLKAADEARRDRDAIAALPGAGALLAEADKLLAFNMIAQGGKPARGYAEAVKDLGKMAALRLKAEETSKAFLEKDFPEAVKLAMNEVETHLKEHEKDCPQSLGDYRKARLADAATKGKEDEPAALQGIKEVAAAVKDDIEKYQAQRDGLAELRSTLANHLKALTEAGAPVDEVRAIESERDGVETLVKTHDYLRAAATLKTLATRAEELTKALTESQGDWEKAEKRMAAVRKSIDQLASWPPLASQALALREEIGELTQLAERKHYVDALAKLADLEVLAEKLRESAKDVPAGEGLDTLAKDLPEARKTVALAIRSIDGDLRQLEKFLIEDGVKRNTTDTAPHLKKRAILAEWEKFLAKPNPETLLTKAEETSDALVEVGKFARDYPQSGAYDEYVKTAQEVDAKEIGSLRNGRVVVLLNSVKVFDEEKYKILERQYQLIGQMKEDEAPAKMQELEELLGKLLKTYEKKLAELRKKALKDLANARKKVEEEKDEWLDFKGFYDELMAELGDAEALLGSADPDLVNQAALAINLVYSRAALAGSGSKSGSGEKLGEGFDDVQKKRNELSAKLKETAARLPDTHAELLARLKDVLTRAARGSAAEAMEALKPLEADIDKAVEQAKLAEALFRQFNELVKKVRGEIGKVSEKAGLGALPSEYLASLEGRFAAAEALSKQEGGQTPALERLGMIQAELDDLAAAPDPGLAVADKNREAALAKDEMKRLAEQWTTAHDEFLKTTIPATEEAMTKKAGKAADLTYIKDMKARVGQLNTGVKPYFKQGKATPDIVGVRKAFEEAFRGLRECRAAADRLATDPLGTNVQQNGDVKRALAQWGTRVEAFKKAATELQNTFRTAASEGPTTPPQTDEQEVLKLKQKLNAAAETACNRIDDAVHFFDEVGAALHAPVQVLSNPNAPPAARLKAREEILRTVRDATKDLLADPVLAALRGKIPAPGKSLLPALGGLNAGLKILEIEALVGT